MEPLVHTPRGVHMCDMCAASRAKEKARALKKFVANNPGTSVLPPTLIHYRRAINRGPYYASGLHLCRTHLKSLTKC